ncbi:MAG TPA: adenylate kinase [Candidatus Omnitrophota bacterium]|nr:adenylate kinase [Candidatus Omnitrophota bacterium]HPS20250.1 adenylate kinase [Candidatus Omnitrophota bacterium]
MSKSLNIVLLGPPGAGKGTQAALLLKEFNVLHVSTGDMLRSAIKEGSAVGKEAAGYMNRGELVPDELVTRAVVERLSKPDTAHGVMLDGYPRTINQAESLGHALAKMGRKLDGVLYFKTSDAVAVQRLSGRRVCRKCAKNYHETNMPPKKAGVCDLCGGELFQRDDDKPETVKNRLKVYQASTADLVEYYRSKKQLIEVDGDAAADKLFKDIVALFKNRA